MASFARFGSRQVAVVTRHWGHRRRIVRLNQGGLSVRKIAALLNDEAVPTAHGGRAWYPTTVQKLLAGERLFGASCTATTVVDTGPPVN